MTTTPFTEHTQLPLLPLRDVVVFPHMVIPLFVGRPKSIKALEAAMEQGKSIMLAAQKAAAKDEPSADDIYEIGCIANILQMLKLPDGTVKVLVEGTQRARIHHISELDTHFIADLTPVESEPGDESEVEAMRRAIVQQFDQYVKLNKKIPPEILTSLAGIDDAGRLADTIAAHLPLKLEQKQVILEIFNVAKRHEHLLGQLEGELDILQVEKRIRGRVKRQMEKAQKEYYLNEKIKAIQKELGRGEKSEIDELKKRIETAGMTKDAAEKASAELKRLENMPPMSAESTVSRNYLDWLLAVPWRKRSKEIRDLKFAEQVLDSDHYGLEKIKDRILEFLAVRRLVKNPKGSILCFVGPPGVGKTSLGMSVAKATGRKFVRMSLGGVRDEAEVRGHRRTYIGALPGQVIQMMKKAGTKNPVFMLDEIDKMAMDFRGDPSSALLEVLDPEQNFMFVDHYLDVEYDLSQVFFIATANVLHTIPAALQDRMEVIRLSGYTELEKQEIARRFLVRKQMEQTGLSPKEIEFTDDGINGLVQYYTREAGVRNLEREVGNVCRKVARKFVDNDSKKSSSPVIIDTNMLVELLGPLKYRDLQASKKNEIGAATGLAWTEVGGQILTIEATLMDGKGKLTITGKLGDVMQESAQAAMSYVRSRAHQLGLPRDFYRNLDIHLHIPEGAIPKDGPSAGITMATTICSALTSIPVRGDIAMTGEITLRGKVLPIGGLKEKLLAAHRHGINEAIMPKDNEKDLPDIPETLRNVMKLHFVESMDEVLRIALEREPISLPLPAPTVMDFLTRAEERAH